MVGKKRKAAGKSEGVHGLAGSGFVFHQIRTLPRQRKDQISDGESVGR